MNMQTEVLTQERRSVMESYNKLRRAETQRHLGGCAFAAWIISAIGLLPGAAPGALIIVPPGLNPGDKYRLVFVTSTTSGAQSSGIGNFNAFVTASAELAALGTTWSAIASTPATHA
jgi:hypothetical protein